MFLYICILDMNKFENVTLGTQSGKTAQILAYLRSIQYGSSDALNIIYTQNTLLNTQQFMARVVSSLPLNRGKIAIIASNFKGFGGDVMRTNKSNFVFGKKISDVPLSEVSVLLQCKNSCRVNSLISVVSLINDRQINVIIDEAHQAIDTTQKITGPIFVNPLVDFKKPFEVIPKIIANRRNIYPDKLLIT